MLMQSHFKVIVFSRPGFMLLILLSYLYNIILYHALCYIGKYMTYQPLLQSNTDNLSYSLCVGTYTLYNLMELCAHFYNKGRDTFIYMY